MAQNDSTAAGNGSGGAIFLVIALAGGNRFRAEGRPCRASRPGDSGRRARP